MINKRLLGMITIITGVIFILSMAGCDNGTTGKGNANLSGTVTIDQPTSVVIGTKLTAAYSGSETVTYQWKKDGEIVGTNATYTPTEAGSYTVTVSAIGYNPKTSEAVTVTAPPVIRDLSGTITISPNSNVFIRTELTAVYSGSEAVTYQWKKDGVDIGTNTNTYTPTVTGTYTVTVSAAGYNSKTSEVVDVGDPTLFVLAGDVTIDQPTSVVIGTELTAAYSGSETVTYQWKKDGVNVGTNTSTYTPTEAGIYTVTVSADGYNPKTSAAVTVTATVVIPDLLGTITITPNSGVQIGTQLTANYSGSESVSYLWEKDGENVGTNANTYTPTQAGTYTVTVSAAGYNSKTSTPVDVSNPDELYLEGTITISPSTNVTTGTKLTAVYSGSEDIIFSYEWWKDGEIISGANSSTYTPTEAGSYKVTIKADGYNHKTSAAITVTASVVINTAAISGVTVPVAGGTPVTTITDNLQYSGTVTWQPNDAAFVQGTEYTATITLAPKTGYTLQGVAADSFTVEGTTSVSNSANSGVITAVFPPAATIINTAAVSGVMFPTAGATPATKIRRSVRIDMYDATGDGWDGNGAIRITVNGVQIASVRASGSGSYYTFNAADGDVVELYWVEGSAQSENSFIVYYADTPPDPAFNASSNITWNGSNALVYKLCDTMDSISGGELLGSFNAADNENAQYTGTVTWSPDHATFMSGTAYTATVTLTPKTGYTLQGVPPSFFTVAGATSVSNSVNSGVITAQFPMVYALGDTGPGGGKVFYFSAEGFTMTDNGEVCHYLEAALNDMSTTPLAWAPSNTAVPGTGTAIGTGRKNTALTLAVNANAPAAKACNEYSNNGKTDWFLPSISELSTLYVNQSYLGNMIKTGTTGYWSSSLSFSSMTSTYMAYSQRFDNNFQTTGSLGIERYVRAIRAF